MGDLSVFVETLIERRLENIKGLRGEFERRRGDLERSREDLDCLNGERARRIGDLVRLRGDLDRATKGGEKRREMFRVSPGEEGGVCDTAEK